MLDEILMHLERIAHLGIEIKLLNTYKGLPVTSTAFIQSFEGKSIIVNVNKYQAVCLQLQRKTFIKNPELPDIVKAQAASTNFARETSVLSDFTFFTSGDIGERTSIRVEPKAPLEVEIATDAFHFQGELANISETGMGVYISHDASLYCLPNKLIKLILWLPTTHSPIKLSARIVHMKKEKADLYRLGLVALMVKTGTHNEILRYISHRQAEILRELHDLYKQLLLIDL